MLAACLLVEEKLEYYTLELHTWCLRTYGRVQSEYNQTFKWLSMHKSRVKK